MGYKWPVIPCRNPYLNGIYKGYRGICNPTPCRIQASIEIDVTYYPMCNGSGVFPSVYDRLERPLLRKTARALDLLTKFSHFGILPNMYNPLELNKAMDQLNIDKEEKEDLLDYKKVYDVMLTIVNDVFGILSMYGEQVSILELQQLMARRYKGFWNPSGWWETINNLTNVVNIEMDHAEWAERSREGEEPNIAECGLHIATMNGYRIGSIWTFSDPRMVSQDGKIRYIFVQGIRSTVPYMIARMLRPKVVPPTSKVLIAGVEAWARQQGIQAIRINPLGNMYRILTKYHGFTSITPEFAKVVSPYIEDKLGQKSIYNVMKYVV